MTGYPDIVVYGLGFLVGLLAGGCFMWAYLKRTHYVLKLGSFRYMCPTPGCEFEVAGVDPAFVDRHAAEHEREGC